MQTKLNYFLGLSDQDSDPGESDLGPDLPQYGNHYWTGVKTGSQLILPGTCD